MRRRKVCALDMKLRKRTKIGPGKRGKNALGCNHYLSLSFRHISLGYCEFSDR